jgi:hypothetical protein
VSDFHKGQLEGLKQKTEAWVAQAQQDTEIGGDAFKQNVELAHRALTKFAPEGFVKMLEQTGLGNHPDLVRTFFRIGKQMSEDQLIIPGAQAGGKKSAEELFYGGNQE